MYLNKSFGNFGIILEKLIAKVQIQVPSHLGRSMFGVMDETGQLQWGQVFVQCTRNIWLKAPSKSAAKVILTGRCSNLS